MKIGITGHTRGIGKSLYDYFQDNNHTVIGFSRSNGHDIDLNQDKIVEVLKSCDVFINNASSNDSQLQLLKKTNKIVPKIITVGSISTNYRNALNDNIKNDLEDYFNKIAIKPDSSRLLLIKPAFIEGSQSEGRIDSDVTVSHKDIINSICFWMSGNEYITKMDYHFKLTEYTKESLKLNGIDTSKF